MSTIFEEAEDEELAGSELADGPRDREITLNSMTVLGIFFGLVLICGLCFGVGFTLGRRSSPESAADVFPPAKGGAAAAGATQEGTSGNVKSGNVTSGDFQPGDSRAKPSASTQGKGVTASATEDRSGPAPDAGDSAQSAKVAPTPSGVPRGAGVDSGDGYVQPAAAAKAATGDLSKGVVAAPAVRPGTFMVQIAAVSNPADGAVLVGALSKRGYTVVIRHEATDALQHVQIGPFASRADAVAMRQKLLADGYNAILK